MAGVLQERVKSENVRQVYTFVVPTKHAGRAKKIGLVELTVHEELMAAKRAQGDSHRLAYELSMQALREIDGNPVSVGDGSAVKAFNDMGPKIRQLVMQAYVKIHAAEDDDAKDFLSSQEIKVE